MQSRHTENQSSDLRTSKAMPTKPPQSPDNVNVIDKNNVNSTTAVAEIKQINILKLDKNKRNESDRIDEPWRKVVSRRIKTIGTAEITTKNEMNTAFLGRNNRNKKV